MGSRLEDKISKMLKDMDEGTTNLSMSSTYDWEDWEDLCLAEKQVQVEDSKIINFPRIGKDPAKMIRDQGD